MKQDNSLTILLIEGSRGNHPAFSCALRQGYRVTSAPTGRAGLAIIHALNHDLVIVDAASMGTSGVRICQSYRKTSCELPIILIADHSVSLPKDIDANCVIHLPFTVQKLANRIDVYQPTDGKFIMKSGPIELNMQTQLVTCQEKQTRLTPRLVKILEILMRNHGKVVKRDPLFKSVWETEYTGDTRTLDVHISWLRQAIEEDPRHPRLIKTVRGVGYLLDL